jgi:hypothetical protein
MHDMNERVPVVEIQRVREQPVGEGGELTETA